MPTNIREQLVMLAAWQTRPEAEKKRHGSKQGNKNAKNPGH